MNSKYYKISLSRYGRNVFKIELGDGRKVQIYAKKLEEEGKIIFEDLVCGIRIYPSFGIRQSDTIEDLKKIYANTNFLTYSRYESIPETILNLNRIKENLDSLTDDDIVHYQKKFLECEQNQRNWLLNIIYDRESKLTNIKEKEVIKKLKYDIDNFKK